MARYFWHLHWIEIVPSFSLHSQGSNANCRLSYFRHSFQSHYESEPIFLYAQSTIPCRIYTSLRRCAHLFLHICNFVRLNDVRKKKNKNKCTKHAEPFYILNMSLSRIYIKVWHFFVFFSSLFSSSRHFYEWNYKCGKKVYRSATGSI